MSKFNDQDLYITIKEASLVSGYSSSRIRQLIRKNEIEAKLMYSSVGKYWVVSREDILRYKKHRLQESGETVGEAKQQEVVAKDSIDILTHLLSVFVKDVETKSEPIVLLSSGVNRSVSKKLKRHSTINTNTYPISFSIQ